MSASPIARQTTDSQSIPLKTVYVDDPSQLPSHYSSTPGGTLFSTTPGGTKIVYEKSFLLHLRQSPISKTPPTYSLPENLLKGQNNHNSSPPKTASYRKLPPRRNSNGTHHGFRKPSIELPPPNDSSEQFHIDI